MTPTLPPRDELNASLKSREDPLPSREELERALREIAKLKPEPIADSGFSTGPKLLFDQAQRIAKAALKSSALTSKEQNNG